MKQMKKLHDSVDLKHLAYYYKGKTADVNFNDFIDAKTLYDKLKSNKVR